MTAVAPAPTAEYSHPAAHRPATASREPLRVGIIGAGKMARHHIRAIGQLRSAIVAAIADPVSTSREAASPLAPSARLFESYDRMLREEALDVVHVCTPPSTHVAAATAALLAGCDVYVEKPFAESAREASELLALASERGRRVSAGHQLLFEAPTRIVDAYLPAIGRVVHVESFFSFRTVRRAPGGRAALRPDIQLLDILPHPVYLLLHVLDRCAAGTTDLVSLELSETGTVHALVRRGHLTAALTVSLEARPVESYLRVSGTNGSLHADYVRGTVERHLGPGSSGIDKVLAPYRSAWQRAAGTTRALARRVRDRRSGYPGLRESFAAFYDAIREAGPAPLSPAGIVETTRICEAVAGRLDAQRRDGPPPVVHERGRPVVVVTGAAGFLGRAVIAELLESGERVRALVRRDPAPWERMAGVEYRVVDLGEMLPADTMADARLVLHAAAETVGGWEEHQRNSIDASEHVLRAAAASGVRHVIHVSSLAVLDDQVVMRDDGPLHRQSRASGPYVWGKLESERLALRLGEELGVDVHVVRPGPIVDFMEFEPPGRLGKRIGNLFVAVGSPRQRLAVVEVRFAARMLAWLAANPGEAPRHLNLLAPEPVSKRQLIAMLRQRNPDVTVVRLPWTLVLPLSWGASALQKVLRPSRPATSIAKAFRVGRYDSTRIAELAHRAGISVES
ncbi:MAG TPA: Gfo/Idh/MocA family oxidoreductase [Gemmatimonadaceae bacterium]|nr:Gfo/Idh/MocA family oxidoreductase [Gemmatimonadaceae bacterium]